MNIKINNIKYIHSVKKALIFLIVVFFSCSIYAQEDFSNDKNIPERPNPPKLVNDFAALFNDFDKYKLEEKLVAYNDSTSTQIAVVTIETLNGYAEDDYAVRLGRKWGIGQKGKNNGVLILVAKEERAISIELGYGIEQYITDTDAKRLIENVMIPNFKQGNFFGGVDAATTDIIAMLQGTYQQDGAVASADDDMVSYVIFALIVIFIIIIIIASFTKGGGGNYTGSSGGWTWTTSSGSGWGGSSWGGSSSGGGFGGFGGGSFGGGGASGRW